MRVMLKTEYDRRYLNWLCNKVGVRRNSPSHETLAGLYLMPYYSEVEFDENRAEDGIYMRSEFSFDHDTSDIPEEWFDEPCRFLEMLVALSERMGMHVDKTTPSTFWHLMRNLGIARNDSVSITELGRIVEAVNDRAYSEDGSGGLFPLKVATTDQRDVELFRQMQDYIMENRF